MVWNRIQLNDGESVSYFLQRSRLFSTPTGTSIPSLAYGTGRLGGVDSAVEWVKQAVSAGLVRLLYG